MDKTLLKRIEALENLSPDDLFIYAIDDNGVEVVERVKDVIDASGCLKDGFKGIGKGGYSLVVRGGNLRDLERILAYTERCAYEDLAGDPETDPGE